MSGSILSSNSELFSSNELTRRTKSIFKNSGCDFDFLSSYDFNICIQRINHSRIFLESYKYFDSTILKGNEYAFYLNPLFQLVNDGIEFNQTIKESIQQRKLKNVNSLSGFTREEMARYLEPIFGLKEEPFVNLTQIKKILNDFYSYFPRYPEKMQLDFIDKVINEYAKKYSFKHFFTILIQILTEEFYVSPIIHIAELFSEKNRAYVYSFEENNPINGYPKWYGVIHGDQIPFIFGIPLKKENINIFSAEQRHLSKQIITYWTNFVKFGDPNGNLLLNQTNQTNWSPLLHRSKGNLSIYNFKSNMILSRTSTRSPSQFTYQEIKRNLNFWKKFENL